MKLSLKKLQKIERIASALEEKLGITEDDAGNTLIDQAEEQVSASTEATACDNLGQKLQERTDKELKDAPDYTPALEASDGEIPSEVPEKTASEPTVAAEEVVADEEFTHEEALAFQASLKKLINIAHTVKMSKDLPASKKEEVLARIQKASEKFMHDMGKTAAKQDDGDSKKKLTTKQ